MPKKTELREIKFKMYYEVNSSMQPFDQLNIVMDDIRKSKIAHFIAVNPIVERYEKQKQLQTRSLIPSRGQSKIEIIEKIIGFNKIPSIVVIENDLFMEGLNWCFGVWCPGSNALIISISRMKNLYQFRDMLYHELGHLMGACQDGRSNTNIELGTHCVNDLCSMQQKMSIPLALEHTKNRYKAKAPPYCDQCLEEMKNQK